ncbi:DUF2795 domain-containing protein [Microbacterium oryzae]|uniref:DUF2795 domain-containing protein n=1 Tax=Microbacterium oryzae TaxID=743009 RepID=UPI0025B1C07D|nr:DUF2795 domain-containing protein [Microbacterium oryzae]MDN3309398.1 DUF2795 domain-containing protein [Microbacterium oryzae]
MQKHLGGIDYPATKEDILASARESGADDDIMKALEAIPDGEYDAPTAVSSAIADAN